MDCDFFDALVDELVRGQMDDAGLKERALDHARQCPQCGIRLSEAQEVSAGLATLAAADGGEQAPERVEGALLSYLREQRQVRRTRQRERWVAAVAAAMLAVGAGVWSWQRFLPAHQNPPAATEAAAPARPAQAAEGKRTARLGVPSYAKAAGAQAASSAQDSGFILLPYGEDAPSVSGTQIVRVAVTPAALVSIGVPVADPSAETYVEADVVVGDDGVARAIRLAGYSGQ